MEAAHRYLFAIGSNSVRIGSDAGKPTRDRATKTIQSQFSFSTSFRTSSTLDIREEPCVPGVT